MVPFLNLAAAYQELKSDIDSAVLRVMTAGQYIGGSEVEAFEEEFAAYCGSRYAVGVGNGLDALHLALRAMGVRSGDEVIVPANTYIATWLAVTMTGAVPVPVEPDNCSFNMNPALVENAITPKTRCILPVHLYGQAADLESIYRIAAKHNLATLEDAAQAHGATHSKKRVGGHSATVAWSFYPGKNLGAMGDAGAVTTNDVEIAKTVRLLRNYGSAVKYQNQIAGYNSRLDPIQAAVLRIKLQHLEAWNERRRVLADYYADALADLPIQLPSVASKNAHVWHLYVIRTICRDKLQKYLRAAGIETLIHYPVPPYSQPAYVDLGLSGSRFPFSTCIAESALSLPIGPHLSMLEAKQVVSAVRSFFAEMNAATLAGG
jgi:dTDP-4-amino-4,6-dideoxygalactose transaminase